MIYNQLKMDIRDILKQLCSYKGVEIIEGHIMPDHIHMLVSILKYKFGNRHFWSEGYYVSTVGLNEATIKKYIQDQENYDIMHSWTVWLHFLQCSASVSASLPPFLHPILQLPFSLPPG